MDTKNFNVGAKIFCSYCGKEIKSKDNNFDYECNCEESKGEIELENRISELQDEIRFLEKFKLVKYRKTLSEKEIEKIKLIESIKIMQEKLNKIDRNNEETHEEISCKTCEFNGNNIHHTCDLCTSLDNEEDYTMYQPIEN